MGRFSRREVLASMGAARAMSAVAADWRPNILLILTDFQGAHMGALGTRGVSTPRMDQLAREGTLFTNAFACTGSCAPSRASILTGMYPHSNGIWRNVLLGMIPVPPQVTDTVGVRPEVPTLPELLNRAGYHTGITAKFHLSPREKFPFHEKIPMQPQTPAAFRTAVKAFAEGAGNQPFFLMANTSFPHRPFRKSIFPSGRPDVDPAAVQLPASLPDLPEVRTDWADYLTAIQCADAVVGGMLDGLKDSGRELDTLVIFAGDQGPAFVRGKATCYDLCLRVPLIVRGPGLKAGGVSRNLVSLMDIAPTVLESAGLPVPGNVQAESLWKSSRHVIFAEHNAHGPGDFYPVRSAFDRRMHYLRNLLPDAEYKFIADTNVSGPTWDNRSWDATLKAKDDFPIQCELLQQTVKRPVEELYDFASDPFEMRNIAADPRYSGHLARMRKAMDEWRRETSDSGDPRSK